MTTLAPCSLFLYGIIKSTIFFRNTFSQNTAYNKQEKWVSHTLFHVLGHGAVITEEYDTEPRVFSVMWGSRNDCCFYTYTQRDDVTASTDMLVFNGVKAWTHLSKYFSSTDWFFFVSWLCIIYSIINTLANTHTHIKWGCRVRIRVLQYCLWSTLYIVYTFTLAQFKKKKISIN